MGFGVIYLPAALACGVTPAPLTGAPKGAQLPLELQQGAQHPLGTVAMVAVPLSTPGTQGPVPGGQTAVPVVNSKPAAAGIVLVAQLSW